ncbi:uncharacterized protein LOC122614669 [Drosophila teissieri]|uniref:uncharacterized protein LOC122614669 n=1 Tax=Drosophila teissieri TaxID=7243 RepID=UPI001CBA03F6|nr:uncharacterized protein LOC122614669 [Drosophila teissieri]
MRRRYFNFWASALLVAISLAGGEPKKLVVFDTIECAIKSSVFAKVECKLYSRIEFNALFTLGEKENADKMLGVCEVQIYPRGQKKITRIKNLRMDFCQLKKHTEKRSVLGIYYQAVRRAVVDFPKKCPFQKNTTYAVNRLHLRWQDVPQYLPESNFTFRGKIYANDELALEVKLTGGFFEIRNDSVYRKPLLESA